MLAEQAVENAAKVEAAYGGMALGAHFHLIYIPSRSHTLADGDEEDEEWTGVGSSSKPKEQEEEFSDDEQLATVTIVEDFDPDTLIHGPSSSTTNDPFTTASIATPPAPSRDPSGRLITSKGKSRANLSDPSSSTSAPPSSKPKKKTETKKKYGTNASRKADKTKQRARKLEKAERAGGKASRKRGGGGGGGKAGGRGKR